MKDLSRIEDISLEVPELDQQISGLGSVFGEIIFSHRMEKKLTQKELAHKSGLGVKTIYRAEGGSSNIGIVTYETIFKALDIEVSDYADLFHRSLLALEKKDDVMHTSK
ncbi:helix-turn-helix domain-containing protein [Salisediminibacterium beveridgei]|uniref:HTH cro/C1-type domain-containing protein n=1 Tax=Salisediminibacterium beveridgei TaxID=632773 RepID=A0A1D7QZH4_9BACI|nr:helix-turn-helix transcriptional regulator [Salisediminibacterium beveridgei]AOM84406.1 hypothetical protein BBEV_3089 [Salisediminibacterium beveridgei]